MPFDNPHQTPFGDLEVLMDARGRILDRSKWLKGEFRDGDRHCLVAALSVAAGSRSFNSPNRTEQRLERLLAKRLPHYWAFWIRFTLIPARRRLMLFNDRPRTSHRDVIALFDRTIEAIMSNSSTYIAT